MSWRSRVWILRGTALAVHEAQIGEHGGKLGVRDQGLLESALARPRNADAYGDPPPSVPTLAALYAIAIIRNHPFLDGNKRVGLVLLELFLNLNGFELNSGDGEALRTIVGLAAGHITDEDFIAWVAEGASAI